MIFPVVLCGCETCGLTVEEHRLGVFENRVLRKIFGRKREEVRGDWGKILILILKSFHDILITKCYSGYQIKEGGMDGAYCTHLGGGFYRVLDGKCEGRTPLGRSWRRREDNIKLWGGVNLSGGLL